MECMANVAKVIPGLVSTTFTTCDLKSGDTAASVRPRALSFNLSNIASHAIHAEHLPQSHHSQYDKIDDLVEDRDRQSKAHIHPRDQQSEMMHEIMLEDGRTFRCSDPAKQCPHGRATLKWRSVHSITRSLPRRCATRSSEMKATWDPEPRNSLIFTAGSP